MPTPNTAAPNTAASSLESWLEKNLTYVEKAAPQVEAGGDLAPMMVALRPDGIPDVMMPKWRSGAEKDATIAVFRKHMAKIGAVQYAIIAAGWAVRLDMAEADRGRAIIEEHGTGHPDYVNRRVEVYNVTVGDRERSLLHTNEAGKIVKLTRGETVATDADNFLGGRMLDLLRRQTAH